MGSPGAGPPGGEKSAHFFGYLITLPVGTVWGHFSDPPFWAILGGYPGTPAEGSVYRTHWTHPVGHSWAGPLGRRASDGYPLGGLSPNGWYVPSGRGPPSRQGRKSAQDREVAGRRRPFARAKRGPTTGVTGKVRKCLAEHIRPCQFQAGGHPYAVRQDLSHWARTAAGRTWDTSPQAIDAPPPLSPRSNAQLSTTTEKSKNFAFLGRFGRPRLAGRVPEAPPACRGRGGSRPDGCALIAQ